MCVFALVLQLRWCSDSEKTCQSPPSSDR